MTSPSSRCQVAPVGHTGTQGGSAQCWQPVTRKKRSTDGNSPISTSTTFRHCTPGSVSLACLHAIVQVWHPTQRLTSMTMPQRGVWPVGFGVLVSIDARFLAFVGAGLRPALPPSIPRRQGGSETRPYEERRSLRRRLHVLRAVARLVELDAHEIGAAAGAVGELQRN